jgi:hypothetical protein
MKPKNEHDLSCPSPGMHNQLIQDPGNLNSLTDLRTFEGPQYRFRAGIWRGDIVIYEVNGGGRKKVIEQKMGVGWVKRSGWPYSQRTFSKEKIIGRCKVEKKLLHLLYSGEFMYI